MHIITHKMKHNTWDEWKTTVYLSILFIIIGWLVITLREDIPTLMVLLMGSPLIALGVWSVVNWVVIIVSFFMRDRIENIKRGA